MNDNEEHLDVPIATSSADTDSISDSKELCSGIFWIVSDYSDLSDYKLLMFEIPCDIDGNAVGCHEIPLNSKSGSTYNHKKTWESEIKNNSTHKPYNKKSYDYYPRGRVEISSNRAIIYLNPNINTNTVVDDIKRSFGLNQNSISSVKVSADNSYHYQCWIEQDS